MTTTAGLFLLDVEEGIKKRYSKEGHGKYFLPTNELRHMEQDEQGIFWIASQDGLIRWDEEKGTTRRFTTEDGFSNNILNGVYEDDFGFLWLSSDNGIIQFHKETYTVKNHLLSDGISNPEFNRSCLLYTSPSPRDATLSRMPSSA